MSGITGTQAELLYSMPAPVTKNNFTTPAQVITAVPGTGPLARIPGGFFGENPNPVGRCLYLQAFGTMGNASAATFQPGVALDPTPGTIVASPSSANFYSPALATTSGITVQWQCQVWFTCTAFAETAMTLQMNGQWGQTTVASGGIGNAAGISGQCASTITGLTAATAYYVELFATWGTASVSNTTTVQQMFLFGLN
jgi:hypothetical protein